MRKHPLLSTAPRLTKQQEKDYIHAWIMKQDREAIGILLHSRSRWMYRVIRDTVPSWIDHDSVLADCLSEAWLSIGNFDTSRGLTAYLRGLIRMVARRSAERQGKEFADINFDLFPDESKADSALTVVDSVRSAVAEHAVGITDTQRMIVERVLSGNSPNAIAEMMGWNKKVARGRIEHVRGLIANCLVLADVSAAPWLSDRDRDAMASQYRESCKSILGDSCGLEHDEIEEPGEGDGDDE